MFFWRKPCVVYFILVLSVASSYLNVQTLHCPSSLTVESIPVRSLEAANALECEGIESGKGCILIKIFDNEKHLLQQAFCQPLSKGLIDIKIDCEKRCVTVSSGSCESKASFGDGFIAHSFLFESDGEEGVFKYQKSYLRTHAKIFRRLSELSSAVTAADGDAKTGGAALKTWEVWLIVIAVVLLSSVLEELSYRKQRSRAIRTNQQLIMLVQTMGTNRDGSLFACDSENITQEITLDNGLRLLAIDTNSDGYMNQFVKLENSAPTDSHDEQQTDEDTAANPPAANPPAGVGDHLEASNMMEENEGDHRVPSSTSPVSFIPSQENKEENAPKQEKWVRHDSLSKANVCVICLVKSSTTILLPCMHLCVCEECAKDLYKSIGGKKCPVCRVKVKGRVKVENHNSCPIDENCVCKNCEKEKRKSVMIPCRHWCVCRNCSKLCGSEISDQVDQSTKEAYTINNCPVCAEPSFGALLIHPS
eukprot:GHVL01023379.1.p2 GENE.GHVL01023379.1~~GHVL01023379.1.p2  ORF type:complete len:477 (-),score=69.80 GHVL01023379.1:2284-3714(-)